MFSSRLTLGNPLRRLVPHTLIGNARVRLHDHNAWLESNQRRLGRRCAPVGPCRVVLDRLGLGLARTGGRQTRAIERGTEGAADPAGQLQAHLDVPLPDSRGDVECGLVRDRRARAAGTLGLVLGDLQAHRLRGRDGHLWALVLGLGT